MLELRRIWERCVVLCLLLLLQSISSIVLRSYEAMLTTHVSITMFLTLLVGAGGNAGNQSAVRMIQRLTLERAKGKPPTWRSVAFAAELQEALLVAGIVGGIGTLRVVATAGFHTGCVLGLALVVIVFVASLVGAVLPLGLARVGLEPAHAGPAIQVIMDLLGVVIICQVGSALL
jgi:Mg/Co/Ni transporter MgtE